jgi:hypothetical protein
MVEATSFWDTAARVNGYLCWLAYVAVLLHFTRRFWSRLETVLGAELSAWGKRVLVFGSRLFLSIVVFLSPLGALDSPSVEIPVELSILVMPLLAPFVIVGFLMLNISYEGYKNLFVKWPLLRILAFVSLCVLILPLYKDPVVLPDGSTFKESVWNGVVTPGSFLAIGILLFLYQTYVAPGFARLGSWRVEVLEGPPLSPDLVHHKGLRRAHRSFCFWSRVLPAPLTREEFGDALEQAETLARSGAKSWRIDRLWIGTVVVALGNTVRDLPRWLSERRRPRGGRS